MAGAKSIVPAPVGFVAASMDAETVGGSGVVKRSRQAMAGLPAQFVEGLSYAERRAVDRWWAGLGDAARAEVFRRLGARVLPRVRRARRLSPRPLQRNGLVVLLPGRLFFQIADRVCDPRRRGSDPDDPQW